MIGKGEEEQYQISNEPAVKADTWDALGGGQELSRTIGPPAVP